MDEFAEKRISSSFLLQIPKSLGLLIAAARSPSRCAGHLAAARGCPINTFGARGLEEFFEGLFSSEFLDGGFWFEMSFGEGFMDHFLPKADLCIEILCGTDI